MNPMGFMGTDYPMNKYLTYQKGQDTYKWCLSSYQMYVEN